MQWEIMLAYRANAAVLTSWGVIWPMPAKLCLLRKWIKAWETPFRKLKYSILHYKIGSKVTGDKTEKCNFKSFFAFQVDGWIILSFKLFWAFVSLDCHKMDLSFMFYAK